MASKISADVASVVDITARRNDSFYLKVELKNVDGSVYDIIDSGETDYSAFFEIFDSNDVLILGFASSQVASPTIIDTSIEVLGATATLIINVSANYMTVRSGPYKYKLYVKSASDYVTNTVMVGKFKVVDI